MAMTISIDDELKDQFCEICKEMGLSASAAFTVFAKAVVRERKIPFTITSESEYEHEMRAYERDINNGLWQSYRDVQEGRVCSRTSYEVIRLERSADEQ